MVRLCPFKQLFGHASPKIFAVFVLAILALMGLNYLNIGQLRQVNEKHLRIYHHVNLKDLERIQEPNRAACPPCPNYWLYAPHADSGYLEHVMKVFKRVGYMRGDKDSEWDVLWSYNYPFVKLQAILENLASHQKVNHFPGLGYITNKGNLVASNFSYIPKAFRMPEQKEEFLLETKKHADKLWVEKSNLHRGIRIMSLQELDLNSRGTFMQEFITHPLLIDGRKFDIGVYTILTSIKPLRVYTYQEEVMLRFCSHEYYPFDPTDVKKYVVADDYTPTWEMPSLQTAYNHMKFSHKQSLNFYLQKRGHHPEKLWSQIRNAIQELFLMKELQLIKSASNYKSTRNFFELIRCDFVVDEDMKVYLMEVNMSPNLSSKHAPLNKNIYQQVVFSTLNLVGVAKRIVRSEKERSDEASEMLVNERDIQIYPEHCIENCTSCDTKRCRLCGQCLSTRLKPALEEAFLEHVNRGNTRRVVPQPMSQQDMQRYQPLEDSRLTEANQLMAWWFRGKCLQDAGWCM
uniref:probable tubulin polyglutamylase ttll-15 isoform X1 n=2 Tax=Pristiophorus japonicus TaxID=55135 RepID=UPI00398F514B